MIFDASRCLSRVFITHSQYGSKYSVAIGMVFVAIVVIACPACDRHAGDEAGSSPGQASISIADLPFDLGPEFQSLKLVGPIEYTDMLGENVAHTGASISIGISEEQLYKLGRDLGVTYIDIETDHDEIGFTGKTSTGLILIGVWRRSNQRLELSVISESMLGVHTIGGEVSSTKELPIDIGPEFHAIETADPIRYYANKDIYDELDYIHIEMTVKEEPILTAMQALGAETREAHEKVWGLVVYFRTKTSTGMRITGGWSKQGELFGLWIDCYTGATFEEFYGRPPYSGYPPEWDEDGWADSNPKRNAG